MPVRIGITLGDCAGIGPEIVDLALKSDRISKALKYKIIGKYLGCSPGQPTIETAHAAADALEEAVTSARRGEIDAVVTGPVHKARMYEARLQVSRADRIFRRTLRREQFRDVLDRRENHCRARYDAYPAVRCSKRTQAIGDRSRRFVARRFSLPSIKSIRRIAVAGLNPHAGESGKIGREEIEIIAPAVAELNRSPITDQRSQPIFTGPFSPTQFFIAPWKVNSMPFSACITIKD